MDNNPSFPLWQWLIWILSLILGVAGTIDTVFKDPPPIRAAVLILGKHQCDPNEGLAEVQMGSRFSGRKYTFTCKNTAKFIGQTIPDDLEIPGASGPLTMKELKK
jgi:hypothetical protein